MTRQKHEPIRSGWLGIFGEDRHAPPLLICQAGEDYCPKAGSGFQYIPVQTVIYTVRTQSASLTEVSWESRLAQARYDIQGNGAVNVVAGSVRRVRVIEVKKGQKKHCSLLYYGITQNLDWNRLRYTWTGNVPLMNYTASLGRKYRLSTHSVPAVVEKKWSGVLPITYRLKWINVWDAERVRKEAGLIWAIWHKGIEVNAWRGKHNRQQGFDQCCPVCFSGIRETVMHWFWECPSAAKAWRWGAFLMTLLAARCTNVAGGHMGGRTTGVEILVPQALVRQHGGVDANQQVIVAVTDSPEPQVVTTRASQTSTSERVTTPG